MSSRRGGHADRAPLPPPSSSSSSSSSSGAKRQVQRLRARDGITIQFSALGKEEEEEEEELYGTPASTPSSSSSAWPVVADGPNHGGGGIAEALEASETLGNAARQPLLGSSSSTASAKAPAATSTSSAPAAFSSSSKFSPSRSITFPSGDKPFLSLMKSLSQELVDPRTGEGVSAGVRHRKIMQNLVKSLSSSSADTTSSSSSSSSSASQQQDSSTGSSSSSTTTSRPLDSRLNLQLFKQFTQSRASTSSTTATATTTTSAAASSSSASSSSTLGDSSKTAPSSPMTSPDSSRFSFRPLSDVEARIEDTKRRLSEVMLQYEPLQRLSKMIDESNAATSGTSGTASKTHFWQKGLSSSASELSTLNSSNGHLESNNNNCCIKEEGEGDFDRAGAGVAAAATGAESNLVVVDGQVGSAAKSSSSSSVAALDKCSMSALARQEDEEFCELYSEDFDFCTDIETTDSERTLADNLAARGQGSQPPNSTDTLSEDEDEEEEGEGEELAPIPYKTLFALTLLTYGYFVVPLPSYVGGMVFGMVLGVMLAVGVIFLAGPRRSNFEAVRRRIAREMGNTARLDLKQQGMVKGWMNEIQNYDPETYHATLTNSVFVRLDGSTLRLSKPNRNIARRAALNEPKPDVTYISQRIYELADSKIYLVPNNLARKRIWNKKYPICVELGRQDNFMSKAEGETSADSEPERSEEGSEGGPLRYQTSGAGAGAVSRYRPTLFLFGRTGREKEEWYQRLLRACSPKEAARRTTSLPLSRSHAMLTSQGLSGSRNSLDELLSSPSRPHKDTAPFPCPPRQRPLQDYGAYMARCMPPPHQQGQQQQQQQGQESSSSSPSPGPSSSPQQSPHGSPGASKKLPFTGSLVQEEAESLAWVNALVGRVAWDFLGEEYWSDWVCKKIQMKLSKIRLPYFMNELTLTELDMGATTPRVLQASKPSVDHQGLWFDLEVCYKGSFLMTLETKMNLARLGKEGDGLGEFGKDGSRPRAYCLADSDEESSSAGSSDEEEASEQAAEQTPGAESFLGGHNKHSKILRFVDKLTKNKYFQKAAETEFIKKKMEEVSNTPLLLTVEVQECRGTLAVNIPPPPTDRIWYGFRTPPKLEMRARPKLGEREVTFVHITDFIEKKLYEEFQKILVMPNMDDVWLHIMHSAMDPRSHGSPDTDPMGTSSGEL